MNIIKIVLILILVYAVYRMFKMLGNRRTVDGRGRNVEDARLRGEDLVQDPCCGVYIPQTQAYTRLIDGKTTYFCNRECCEKYLARKK